MVGYFTKHIPVFYFPPLLLETFTLSRAGEISLLNFDGGLLQHKVISFPDKCDSLSTPDGLSGLRSTGKSHSIVLCVENVAYNVNVLHSLRVIFRIYTHTMIQPW